ncbi:hypothetical protein KBA41_07635 [Candidatus Ozemobacteraceae bacterium]|nr:hypothetical protein [Candidatus Ozemobacteraceae bacterium]
MVPEERRRTEIADGIAAALDRAVAMAFLMIAGLVAAGHLGLAGEGLSWGLAVREPALVSRIAVITAWDLGSSFLVLRWWRKPLWNSPIGEALLTLIASLILWRVLLGVGINLVDAAFPSLLPAWAIAYAPPLNADLAGSGVGLAGLWLFTCVLATAKETIARQLLRLDERADSPLCCLFAWHHRKDAMFSFLGCLAFTATAMTLSPRTAGILVAFVKFLLLGSASLAIFHRCALQLLTLREVGVTSGEMRDRMKAKREDEERDE